MENKLSKNKNVSAILFLFILVALIFVMSNHFYEKLQTNAFMEYSTGEFKCFSHNGLRYELPRKWFCEINTSDGLYKNVFKDFDDKLYGYLEIFVGDDVYSDNSIITDNFYRSNITINGIKFVLLENKVLLKDGTITRNFNYYAVQNNKRVAACFSSYDNNVKENITILYENILSRIEF